MTKVLARLANMQAPAELLDQINIEEVFGRFSSLYGRLDDLKQTRTQHEQRNWFSRAFNKGELKDAQLDAQELQAEFSKTLAQLMVISHLQATELKKQQDTLEEQQAKLLENTRKLNLATGRINEQQDELFSQSESLRELVEGQLHVRGLTADHAAVLIDIAKEIENTKADMIDHVAEQLRLNRECIIQDIETSKAQIDRALSKQKEALVATEERFSSSQKASASRYQSVLQTLEAHKIDQAQHIETVKSFVEQVLGEAGQRWVEDRVAQKTAMDSLASTVTELSESFRSERKQVKQQHRYLWIVTSIWIATTALGGYAMMAQ